jgi:hypothetical protein
MILKLQVVDTGERRDGDFIHLGKTWSWCKPQMFESRIHHANDQPLSCLN